jgi:uncharacterized membrane protein
VPDLAEDPAGPRAQLDSLAAQIAQLQQRVRLLEEGHRASAVPPPLALPPLGNAQLESRFGLTVVNRVGALTLAIGIIFFFKYAVDSQWIGAAGRVVLGLTAGLLLVFAAEWLSRREQRVFSQGIGGCGIATLYISLYAAFAYYRLVSQPFAFIGLAAVCVIAVALSFRYRNPAIAALGFIGGLLTPVLLTTAASVVWVNFPYLLLLDVTCVAIAVQQHWPVLIPGVSGLTVFAAWFLFNDHHPGWFAFLAFTLAAVHFGLARRSLNSRSDFNGLYLTGHACFILAVLRELELWISRATTPANRGSLVSGLASLFLGLYGVLMLIYGMRRRSSLDRALGLFLLSLLIAKLYLWDVWFLTRFYRTTAFVALGALLLAASYLYSRWKSRPNADS